MIRKAGLYILTILILISVHACVKEPTIKTPTPTAKPDGAGKPGEVTDDKVTMVITEDTVWEGTVTVDGLYKVAKGVTLTIKPGTTVEFTYHDYDKDGQGDSGLIIEGAITARGTYKKPITFTAVKGRKQSGAWGMILINFSNDVIFDYCKFEYSTFTLHIHFSTGSITNSLFTNNEDGTRIGRSRMLVYNNVFKDNRIKGVNFTDSKNDIKYNEISGNKHGIFLFEGDKGSTITRNNIYDNKIYNLKIGDFFVGDLSLDGNYWGELSEKEIRQKIFDKKFDDTLGVVSTKPVTKKRSDTGIIKALKIEKVFEFEAEGFIDSTAAVDEESRTIYFGSYDGYLYAIDADTGALRFKFDAGDVIDSSPAVDDQNVYFTSWNLKVYCLDKLTGELKWTYAMKPSAQDDHRQSSPVVHGGLVYIGGYDGTVYALDVQDGEHKWKFATGGAIRSKGVISNKTIIFGSADGSLYGLSLKSGRGAWVIFLGSEILSTPLVLDDAIIVATKGGNIFSIDKKSKAVTAKFNSGSVNFYAAPISYKGGIAFATTKNRLLWLKKKGLKIKGAANIAGPAYATPVVYEDFLLSPTNLGNLNVIERGTGMKVVDYFLADAAIQSTPVEFDGKLYFGARDNKFYAITISTITTEGF